MKKMWSDAWGVRMEHVLRNALLLLLDQPEATLLDIQRLFVDDDFRKSAARNTGNETVQAFWLKEYPLYSKRYQADSMAPILNKIGAFLADPNIRGIVTAHSDEAGRLIRRKAGSRSDRKRALDRTKATRWWSCPPAVEDESQLERVSSSGGVVVPVVHGQAPRALRRAFRCG
jgi:hypothetical protein